MRCYVKNNTDKIFFRKKEVVKNKLVFPCSNSYKSKCDGQQTAPLLEFVFFNNVPKASNYKLTVVNIYRA